MNLGSIFDKLSKIRGALPASYSRMSNAINCPRSWIYNYGERKNLVEAERVETPDTRKGSILHDTLEEAMKYTSKNKLVLSPEQFKKELLCHTRKSEAEETIEYVRSLLQGTYTIYKTIANKVVCSDIRVKPEMTMRIDKRGKRQIYRNWNECGWIGIADLVLFKPNECVIIDYKSEYKSDERQKLVLKQMALYANALLEGTQELRKIKTVCAYLGDASFETISTWNKGDRTLDAVIQDFFDQYYEAIMSNDETPRAGYWCSWCGVKRICSEGINGKTT